MGALSLQEILTCATRIVSGAPTYIVGNDLESVEHVSTGVYQLNFARTLNAQEQMPYVTVVGTDPTSDYQIEIVGGGPTFTALQLAFNVGGSPADLDCFFLMEQIRIEDSN